MRVRGASYSGSQPHPVPFALWLAGADGDHGAGRGDVLGAAGGRGVGKYLMDMKE